MTTKTDDMNAEIAKLDRDIKALDGDIEGRERRLAMVRQHRERLLRVRATLQGQLEREEAPLAKPTGPFVTIKTPDGKHWRV